MRARVGRDRGSASVWGVVVIAVLCVVFGVVLSLGHAVVVRHRAAGGADLAALAAADHWTDGEAAACDRAERVAREQGARLVRCAVVGEVSDVTARSGGGPFTAEARARAGPVGVDPGDLGPATRGPAGLGHGGARLPEPVSRSPGPSRCTTSGPAAPP
ncbi:MULTISPECIES: Rv3654c family TadE-like protein [Streptomyces]|uniref:Rv3654c family TadE-like protein n=1 Tax=Streptomyces TaxID=1883 RepID=UPI00143E0832|nr:Rv3654c family TadE-like protein [Streptomyces lasalocidi]